MKLEISDVSLFKSIFRGITRMVDTARFDIDKNGIRIRSIDPHDFCYIDIKLTQFFFDKFEWKLEKISQEADIGLLRHAIAKIERDEAVFLVIEKQKMSLTLRIIPNTN